MNADSIGRQVGWARRRARMTQHDLARATKIPQPSIARIERGTVTPRTATLIEILEATGHRLAIEAKPADPAVDRDAIRRQLRLSVPRRTLNALGKAGSDTLTSPVRALRRLRRFAVPFVLIGELAEVAHGAPGRIGRTIEVCMAATDVARERLEMARADLGAKPPASLEVVTETAAGDPYEVLLPNALAVHPEPGIQVRVAAIEDLIRIRRARCTPEDLQAAEVLRAIAEMAPAAPTPRPRT